MEALRTNLERVHLARRNKLLKQIKGDAALFVSAPERTSSRDLRHTYRPDSDIYYFTGITEPEVYLLLLGLPNGPRSILFLRERDLDTERWEGERTGLKRARRRFQVDEVRDIRSFSSDLPSLLRGAQTLHFSPGVNDTIDSIVWELFRTPVGPRLHTPHSLRDVRLLTSEMRFVKDRDEIRTLRHAVDLTASAFLRLFPELKSVTSELHAARLLESHFSRLGAQGPSFPTIIASGKNATYLHHSPSMQPLWKKELVLIDAGAVFRGYAGDLTRTVPVSGKFTTAQAEIYDVVHSAVQRVIKGIKPGVTLNDLHEIAVEEITNGLVEVGVLKGSPSTLIATQKHRKYFMHKTSHWLGLDVHDIAPVLTKKGTFEASGERELQPGVVFTIEPGIYIDAKDESVSKFFRGIGIRLEENVLVTEQGCENLSQRLPLQRTEIETLCS